MLLLQSFQDLNFVNSEYGLVVEYRSFLQYLRKNHAKGIDRWHEVKKYNVDFKFKDDFVTHQEVPHLPVTAILKFAFNHKHMMNICKIIADDVEDRLFNQCMPALDLSQKKKPVKDLYDEVSKSDLIICKDSAYAEVQSVPDSDIPSLVLEHKDSFDSTEWSRIVFFEFHFNKVHPQSCVNSPSIQLKMKYEYLETCQVVYKLAPEVNKQHSSLLKERKLRKDSGGINEFNKEMNGPKQRPQHLSAVIDDEVTNLLREHQDHGEDFALTLNCDYSCKHTYGLHLLVCLSKEYSVNHVQDLSSEIIRNVENNHNDKVKDIVFVKEGCLQSYSNDAGDVNRSLLFKDVTHGSLSADILYVYQNERQESKERIGKCETCYTSCPIAFELLGIDIEREWFLDVPLPMQILFETFLNPFSLLRCQKYDDFLTAKIIRMYELYDSLLSLYNSNYSGIIQDIKAPKRIRTKKPSLPSDHHPSKASKGSVKSGETTADETIDEVKGMSADDHDTVLEEEFRWKRKARKRKRCAKI